MIITRSPVLSIANCFFYSTQLLFFSRHHIIVLIMSNNETKKTSESIVNMEELVLPNDANGLNNLFGGRLLQWIDIAGAMAAMKHSRKEVVTVGIDSVDFREPVRVGDMVKLNAKVTWTGKTSMEVKVNVMRE